MSFKEDLQAFINILNTTNDETEAKKEYRKLVQLYHPDHAPEKDKNTYNEYILLINKVYTQGKTKTKETDINTQKEAVNKTYYFTKIGPDGKQYSYKCYNYYDYLFRIARHEYDIGHELLHFPNLNHSDKKAMMQNSLEVMQHFRNSIKCYKFLRQNCRDEVILSTCDFDINMVQKAINILSRTIAEDNEIVAVSEL